MKGASREQRATEITLGLLASVGFPRSVKSSVQTPGSSWYDTAMSSALYQPVTLYRIGPGGLWKHSIVSAFFSQVIAEEQRLWNPSEAYLAGLLHDSGLAALERFIRNHPELARLIQSSQHLGPKAEEMILGFDHAYLSGLICNQWQLTHDLCAAVASHHELLRGGRITKLAAILHVADAVSPIPEDGTYKPQHRSQVAPEAMDVLGLGVDDINRLVSRVPFHLRTA